MIEISKHSRCEVIVSIVKSLTWMTCLEVLFNIKKLLDSEIFEIEYICSTLIFKVNFGSQKHLLIGKLGGSLLYDVVTVHCESKQVGNVNICECRVFIVDKTQM